MKKLGAPCQRPDGSFSPWAIVVMVKDHTDRFGPPQPFSGYDSEPAARRDLAQCYNTKAHQKQGKSFLVAPLDVKTGRILSRAA